jgi:hypothetical protein
MNYLLYTQSRAILSTLRVADRITEQYLNFGTTGWLNYIVYQGQMTSADIIASRVQTSSANKTIVLGTLPTLTPTSFIVKTGDFIQIDRYAYIATANVLRGAAATVSIPVHRSLMTVVTAPVAPVIGQFGTTAALGGSTYTGITFPVIVRDYPTYTLVPMTNDSFISWSGEFSATEVVL